MRGAIIAACIVLHVSSAAAAGPDKLIDACKVAAGSASTTITSVDRYQRTVILHGPKDSMECKFLDEGAAVPELVLVQFSGGSGPLTLSGDSTDVLAMNKAIWLHFTAGN